jgi:hypothetical protein
MVTAHGVAEYTIAGLAGLMREGFVSVAPDTTYLRITDAGRDALASS